MLTLMKKVERIGLISHLIRLKLALLRGKCKATMSSTLSLGITRCRGVNFESF